MTTSTFIKKLSIATAGAALVIVGLIGGTQPSSAQSITFDRDAETEDALTEPFTSVDAPGVSFSDPAGELFLLDGTADNAPETNGTQGLSNFSTVSPNDDGDGPSGIQFDFTPPVTSLEFNVGNDSPGSYAQLETILTGGVAGQTIRELTNGDDAGNDFIQYQDGAIERAIFTYTDVAGNPLNLVEVVDNVAVEPVPEPSSVLGLVTFGAFGAVAVLKRKRQKCNN